MKKWTIGIILYFIFFNNFSFSEEIPIIVISAGKSAQSKGVVGSDIEIINSKTLAESSYSNQLGDVITDNISGENFHLDSTIQMQAL